MQIVFQFVLALIYISRVVKSQVSVLQINVKSIINLINNQSLINFINQKFKNVYYPSPLRNIHAHVSLSVSASILGSCRTFSRFVCARTQPVIFRNAEARKFFDLPFGVKCFDRPFKKSAR